MSTCSSQISIPEVKEALGRSGYLVESRVEGVLRRAGYYVDANSTYSDPATGKSREIDLFAISARQGGPERLDLVWDVILVECSNNPQPLAFLTRDPLVNALHREHIKVSGLPVKIPRGAVGGSWEMLSGFLRMETYHHWCAGRLATQFCCFQRKKNSGEWMAHHEDSDFSSFVKLCDALDFYSKKHFQSWLFGEHENVNLQFYYPVLLVQGSLLDVRQRPRSLRVSSTQHIHFRQSAIREGEEVDYHIDVVTERFFPRYLLLVENEMKKAARLMRRRGKIVRMAIDRIAKKAGRLRSPERIQAALDFRP
ncbi:MAG: hypothetical protein ABSG86_07485 [Thermoguttaceae bacterium]|jgi:hypothetical protein